MVKQMGVNFKGIYLFPRATRFNSVQLYSPPAMSPPAPVLDKSPAKSEQLFPYHLPLSPEWAEYNDWYSQTAMTSAAAGMFIKQPMYVHNILQR